MAADDGSATLRAYTDATRAIMRMVARSRHDEQPVFEAILECSRNLCRVDLCSLLMVTEDPNNLLLVAVAGHTLSTFEVGVTTFATDTNQNLAVAYREKRTIHTEDMRDTELYRAGDSTRRMIVDIEGMRSQLVIPLYSGDT
jgi:GAF domain-containing protein